MADSFSYLIPFVVLVHAGATLFMSMYHVSQIFLLVPLCSFSFFKVAAFSSPGMPTCDDGVFDVMPSVFDILHAF